MKWILLVALIGTTGYAVDLDDVETRIRTVKSKIMGQSHKSRRVMAGLFDLRKKLKKTSKDKSEVEEEIFALRSNLKSLSIMVKGLELETSEKGQVLKERVVGLYKMGTRGLLGALFTSGSSSEFDRNIRILNLIIANDLELMSTYKDNIDLIRHKQHRIKARMQELEAKRSHLAKLEQKLGQQAELNQRIVRSLKKTRSKYINELAQYREQLREVEMENEERSMLRTLLNPVLSEKKGQLPMPVAGRVTRPYGLISLRGNNVQIRNKGVFIAAPIQSTVHAVFAGDVIYAQRFPDKNQTVIIDHGSNYYSVYSNIEGLSVREGQAVEEGTEIGLAAFSPFNQRHGIHFEIRYFSDPHNPMDWVDYKRSVEISALQPRN